MKEKIIDFLKRYYTYILIGVIIILIIIIGFLYADKSTLQYKEIDQEENINKEVTKEEIKEVKKYRVDIKGKVKNPGVYEIEEGKRVVDVINVSGGLLKNADTSYINLSKKIKDEMVIIIYSQDEIKKLKEKEEKKEEKEEKEEKVIIRYETIEKECICPNNTNDACIDKEQLVTQETSKNEEQNNEKIVTNEVENKNQKDTLISINNATKEELMSISGIGESKADSIIEYRKENEFKSIEDIKNISGIGDSLFEKIKNYITV